MLTIKPDKEKDGNSCMCKAARKPEFAPGDLVEYTDTDGEKISGVVAYVDSDSYAAVAIVDNSGTKRVRYVSFSSLRKYAKDPVSHPSHYTSGSIECIDAMEAAFGRREVIIFSKLNAFKYIWRAELKNNELQDLEKAGWYLNKAIELLKEEAQELHPLK